MIKAKIVASKSTGMFGNATANLKRWMGDALRSRSNSTDAVPEGYAPVSGGTSGIGGRWPAEIKANERGRSRQRQQTTNNDISALATPPCSNSPVSPDNECWSILELYPDIRQDPRYDEDRLSNFPLPLREKAVLTEIQQASCCEEVSADWASIT